MSKGKVMLAMSGGVDSSVSVAVLREAGYEVEGLTMCLGDFSVVEKAAESADCFGIKHHWVDLTEDFDRDVKSYFVKEYKNGRTPNPCVICNKKVKLGKLFQYAETLGFDYFATTLTISPLKNAGKLNEIGEELSQIYKVEHLPSDFKKKNGYRRSVELSAEYGLYRQNYCGCVFSKREQELREEP